MTVAELRRIIDRTQEVDDHLLAHMERDRRSGVRALVAHHERRQQRLRNRQQKARNLRALDERYWNRDVVLLAGVDEVGRGCIAGPVVAAAVILSPSFELDELDDSKRLNRTQRQRCSEFIHEHAHSVSFGCVEPAQIDRVNILQASLLAMRRAVEQLDTEPQQVLVDGKILPKSRFSEEAVIHGDSRSLSIAAASVIAKVYRDRLMARYADKYPKYGFEEHKGYGTAAHLEALRIFGPTPLHRRSFAPVASCAAAAPSIDFAHFFSSLKAADSLEQLAAVAAAIKAGSAAMSDSELNALRQLYRERTHALDKPGPRAEELAARHLESKGYRLERRNYRGAGGEIDLIVRRGSDIVFVEVKSSGSTRFGPPEDRVRHEKRKHLVRAARHYLRHASAVTQYRFDVIAVVGSGETAEISHFEDAFGVGS